MSFLSGWFSKPGESSKASQPAPTSGCPVAHDSSAPNDSSSQCPVDHKNMKNHPFLTAQQALRPALKRGLSEEREISTIPRLHGGGTASTPEISGHSAPEDASSSTSESNWVYPSPAQFYAALQRKHRTEAHAKDMDVIVPIHNAVNEKCWADVLNWELNEAHAAQDQVKLVSFKGRPQDVSPRARLYSLLGYAKPFDRHDWVVDRAGKRTRYVIDFYAGKAGPLSFYLDVRPALDDFDGVAMRTRRFWGSMLPSQRSPPEMQQQQTR